MCLELFERHLSLCLLVSFDCFGFELPSHSCFGHGCAFRAHSGQQRFVVQPLPLERSEPMQLAMPPHAVATAEANE